MSGEQTPKTVQPPAGVLGYLVYRIFNVFDKIVPDATESWSRTVRAIMIMITLLLPLLTIACFAVLTVTNQGGKVWRTSTTLAAEYRITAAQLSLAATVCGAIALLVRKIVKSHQKQGREGRNTTEKPALEQDRGSDLSHPVKPRQRRAASATRPTQEEVALVPRQNTDRDRGDDPN